jgi:hypothetical protein
VNNSGNTLVKVIALAGGAALGALLARWLDELLSSQAQERHDFDKSRYEQGLTPVEPKTVIEQESSPAEHHND